MKEVVSNIVITKHRDLLIQKTKVENADGIYHTLFITP